MASEGLQPAGEKDQRDNLRQGKHQLICEPGLAGVIGAFNFD
jgi:hypothetical protein